MAVAATLLAPSGNAQEAPRSFRAETYAEIQVGLCSPVDHTVRALDLQARGTPITVWQFDDDALTLLQHGVRLRLRVAVDGSAELTLKVADQDCARINRQDIAKGEGKCEYDMYGARMAGAVSITRKIGASTTDDLLAGRLRLAEALSPSQRRYLRDVVRVWPLPGEIGKLGPMQVQRYRTQGKGHVYDVEISRLPNDEQFSEISRKVPVADATRAMAVLEKHVLAAGVAACGDQSSPAGDKLRALRR